MTASVFSDAMGEISEKYIMEAVSYQPKKKHIIWPRVRSAAACFLLAVLLTGSAILTFSVEARAAFFGWVREQYENFYVYFFEGEAAVTDPVEYELGWLPDGCVYVTTIENESGEIFIYTDERDTLIRFSYDRAADSPVISVDSVGNQTIDVTINGCPGEISISPSEDETDHISWVDNKTNTLFFISGHFDQETFIRMAESVKEKE